MSGEAQWPFSRELEGVCPEAQWRPPQVCPLEKLKCTFWNVQSSRLVIANEQTMKVNRQGKEYIKCGISTE